MAKDPIRITRYKPGQGLAEGLEKSGAQFSQAVDTMFKGALGLGGLKLQEEHIDNALAIGMANAANTAELNRIREHDINTRNTLTALEMDRKSVGDVANRIIEDRKINLQNKQHFREQERLDQIALYEEQNRKRDDLRDEKRDIETMAQSYITDGDYLNASNVYRANISKDPNYLNRSMQLGRYSTDIKNFNEALSEFEANPTASLEEKSRMLQTMGTFYARTPSKFKENNTAYPEKNKEITTALNTKNAMLRMFDPDGEPLKILSRYYRGDEGKDTLRNFTIQIQGAQSTAELEGISNQIIYDIKWSSEVGREKIKALNALEKSIFTEVTKETGGDISGALPMISYIRSEKANIQRMPGFNDLPTDLSPDIKTKEEVEERRKIADVKTAGVGGKVWFQKRGSDKVELADFNEAKTKSDTGKGSIVGSYGTKIDEVTPNMQIFDAEGTKYIVGAVTKPTSRIGSGFTMGPHRTMETVGSKVLLSKVEKSGNVSLVPKPYSIDEIRNKFSSSEIVKPDPEELLLSKVEIPDIELKQEGYSGSEAYDILLQRLEAKLGRKATPDEIENIYSDVLPSIGYKTQSP